MNRQGFLIAVVASLATAGAMVAIPQMIQRETAVSGAGAAFELAQADPDQLAPQAPARVVPQSMAQVNQSFAPIVQRTAPAVVSVFSSQIVRRSNCPYTDPFWAAFYCGRNVESREEKFQNSLGSGVIVSADGVIVTNNHVVEEGDEFRVVLADRREFPAKLVLADARTDLAILKIETGADRLPTLAYADTRNVLVGDIVLAIGNPFGVGQTVTSGIVSALARTDVGVSDYASFIQTDASINPGNSGGALVDVQGRLVGVNTLIFSRGGGSNGVGFAIPSEMVKRVVDAAMSGGTLVRPWVGAKTESVSAASAKALGLDRPRGVLIAEIFKGGPADQAGLRKGDVILTIDDREVFDDKGLKFVAATKAAGEGVSIVYLREGRERTVTLKLARLPGTSEAELKQVQGRNPFSGAVMAELSPALAEEIGLDPVQYSSGMMVYRVPRGSIAGQLGLRPGDVVREVNGSVIRTEEDLEKTLARNNPGGQWRLAIERNGQRN
jgi:Do/DeqQ family serine protease